MYGMNEYLMIAHEMVEARLLASKTREHRDREERSSPTGSPPEGNMEHEKWRKSELPGNKEGLCLEPQDPRSDHPPHHGDEPIMNENNEKQVRNLEKMNEQEAHRFLTELLSRYVPEEEYNFRHEDYVMEMPQSGERFRGRENMRKFQESRGDHATPPQPLRLRRVLVREGLWVAEGVIDYGDGQVFSVVLIFELRDGKMWRDRWYFAEPFEAPGWRALWIERIETGACRPSGDE